MEYSENCSLSNAPYRNAAEGWECAEGELVKGSWPLVGTAPGGRFAVAMIVCCNQGIVIIVTKRKEKRVSCPRSGGGGGGVGGGECVGIDARCLTGVSRLEALQILMDGFQAAPGNGLRQIHLTISGELLVKKGIVKGRLERVLFGVGFRVPEPKAKGRARQGGQSLCQCGTTTTDADADADSSCLQNVFYRCRSCPIIDSCQNVGEAVEIEQKHTQHKKRMMKEDEHEGRV